MNYESNHTCNDYKTAYAYYVSEGVFLKTNVDLGEMSTVAYPGSCKGEGLQWDGGGGVGGCGGGGGVSGWGGGAVGLNK